MQFCELQITLLGFLLIGRHLRQAGLGGLRLSWLLRPGTRLSGDTAESTKSTRRARCTRSTRRPRSAGSARSAGGRRHCLE
jgi:hypothetical protein